MKRPRRDGGKNVTIAVIIEQFCSLPCVIMFEFQVFFERPFSGMCVRACVCVCVCVRLITKAGEQ